MQTAYAANEVHTVLGDMRCPTIMRATFALFVAFMSSSNHFITLGGIIVIGGVVHALLAYAGIQDRKAHNVPICQDFIAV